MTALCLSLGVFACRGRAADASDPAIDRFIDFQKSRYGVPPAEFDYDASGPRESATLAGRPAWRTSVDLFAPSPKFVLIQASAGAAAEHFRIALLRDSPTDAPALAVSLKLVSGNSALGAGLLWRAESKDDYEAVLVGGPEQAREVRLLRMDHGQLIGGARAQVAFTSTEWHTLEASALRDRIILWLDGRQVFDAPALSPALRGRVGLITSGDTVAVFDDFRFQMGRKRVARRASREPEPRAAPTLHVAEILTTAADFKTRREVFGLTGSIYWRVRVADARSQPVPGAVVRCELVASSGRVLGQEQAMTGTDGVAWFSQALPAGAEPGACAVRVKSVVHADEAEAAYTPQSNRQSSADFTLQP